jgi:hypothetical protein
MAVHIIIVTKTNIIKLNLETADKKTIMFG